MALGLPVSRLISVSINLSPSLATNANVNTPMFIGDTANVIDIGQRFRPYTTLASVANDFGTSAPEYLAAALYFAQTPTPQLLYIGFWAFAHTKGLNVGGYLSSAQQAMTNWTTITSGGFTVTFDGGSATNVTGLNFSGATTLNGVATIIQTALPSGCGCTWNGNQFTLVSSTFGTSSSVSYTSAPGSGTNIAGQLKNNQAGGARLVAGSLAEAALAAVTAIDNALPGGFYTVFMATPDIVIADMQAIAAYIETDSIANHMFGCYTNDPNALNSGATTDIGYLLKTGNGGLGYNRSFVQYSSTTPYATASALALMANVNFQVANSTITLMYKQEPAVTPEILTVTQAGVLDSKNYNYCAAYNNGVAILENGECSSGIFIDEQQGADWLLTQIQTDEFNLLAQSPKVPQTEAGMHTLTTTVRNSMLKGVINGLIGPGTWAYPGFGSLAQGQFMDTGFYVYSAPLAQQALSARLARQAPLMQAAVIFAGAIQTTQLLINVMR